MKGEALALAADLHLSPGEAGTAGRLRALLEAASRRASALYFLGDLFDFWVGRGMEDWKPWKDYLEVFRSSPIPLHFLAGNRDFLAGPAQLERMGIHPSPEETLVEDQAGRKWLLLHGDQLCTRDVAYQRARRLLRSLPVRGVSRALPLGWKLRLARVLRRKSQRSLSSRDPRCLVPTLEAVRARSVPGLEGILCGHLHKVGCFSRAPGEDPFLFVLPPWVEGGEWVLLEEGTPLRLGPGGEEVPWPPQEVLA